MCLLKTHNEPKIAQNDIEVWKVLTSEGLSPFQNYPYHPGINKPAIQKETPLAATVIEDGYLHAYRSKEKAEIYVTKYNIMFGCMANIIPVECVAQRMLIPKGTAYYEGIIGDVCSECLYWPTE